MKILSDLQATLASIFEIGSSVVSGAKTLRFKNGFTLDLVANPTEDKVINLLAIPTEKYSLPVEVTANKTLALTDISTNQIINSSSGVTVTIPAESSVNFPIGSTVEFTKEGIGNLTIDTTGLIIVSDASSPYTLETVAHIGFIQKIGSDEWLVKVES